MGPATYLAAASRFLRSSASNTELPVASSKWRASTSNPSSVTCSRIRPGTDGPEFTQVPGYSVERHPRGGVRLVQGALGQDSHSFEEAALDRETAIEDA